MALINCPECSTEVSDKAMTCTKCGVQLRKAKRGVFGNIVKYLFIGFNLLMVYSFFSGMNAASKTLTTTGASEAAQAGAAIGTGIGVAMLLGIWAFGDIVLGFLVLFTKPK